MCQVTPAQDRCTQVINKQIMTTAQGGSNEVYSVLYHSPGNNHLSSEDVLCSVRANSKKST